mmetsp:Transcript_36909/g.60839  ORF Transcript_36909/g.60839 Transcript_36909/m.60839 type:complete len:147 (-) Transcript_36909:135-575(-)
MPPFRAKTPPMQDSKIAAHAVRECFAPNTADSTPVHAGVMLPSTAFRPGSNMPSEALFVTTLTAATMETGTMRRAQKRTKRELQMGIFPLPSISLIVKCCRSHKVQVTGHSIANCRKVRKDEYGKPRLRSTQWTVICVETRAKRKK